MLEAGMIGPRFKWHESTQGAARGRFQFAAFHVIWQPGLHDTYCKRNNLFILQTHWGRGSTAGR